MKELWDFKQAQGKVISGTDLAFVHEDKWDGKTTGRINGGVTLWNLKALREAHGAKNPLISTAEEVSASMSLSVDPRFIEMFRILCETKDFEKYSVFLQETEKRNKDITTMHSYCDTKRKESTEAQWQQFINNFELLYKEYLIILSSPPRLSELIDLLLVNAQGEGGDYKKCYMYFGGNAKKMQELQPKMTEERVFDYSGLSESTMPLKFNYLAKIILPELDNTPRRIITHYILHHAAACESYLKQLNHILRNEAGGKELKTQLAGIVILHFDVCKKPWSDEGIAMIKTSPDRYILLRLYWDILRSTPFSDTGTLSPTPSADDMQKIMAKYSVCM